MGEGLGSESLHVYISYKRRKTLSGLTFIKIDPSIHRKSRYSQPIPKITLDTKTFNPKGILFTRE